MSKIPDPDWEKLRLAFEQRSLVLVLGPWLSNISAGPELLDQMLFQKGEEEKTKPKPPIVMLLPEALSRFFAKKLKNPATDLDAADLSTTAGLLVKEEGRATLEVNVDTFFRNNFEPTSLQKDLAQLPFPIVINAACDKQFCKALDWHNIAYREEIYNFKHPRDFKYESADNRAFIYHLFGAVNCVEAETRKTIKSLSSLVLTGSDQVEFLKQVVQTERKIPNTLLAELNATKTYLFLGFNFEDWYLRLLLFALGLSDNPEAMPSWALHTGAKELKFSTSVFFSSRYKLNFLPLTTKEFVADLIRRYREAFTDEKPATVQTVSGRTLKVFILNAPEDKNVRDELTQALIPLKNRYNLQIWEDPYGENLSAAIARQLDDSQFIFPIISINLLGSEELGDLLETRILPKDEPGKTIVSPILAGTCYWKPVLRGPVLNAVLPGNLKSVNEWPDRAQAWTDIVQEIEKRIKIHFA